MNRRYLIDDVCLWCARGFAVLALFYALTLVGQVVAITVHHYPWPNDFFSDWWTGVRPLIVFLAVPTFWLFGLWNLESSFVRILLVVTALLAIVFMFVRVLLSGIVSADVLGNILLLASCVGLPSMICVGTNKSPSPAKTASYAQR